MTQLFSVKIIVATVQWLTSKIRYIHTYIHIQTYIHTYICIYAHQDQQKLFITGQAKLNPEHYSIKCVGADKFTTADIFFLLHSYRSKNYTCHGVYLLSFLHNSIPCKHNAWAADNLAPLDMPFLSILAYYNKPKKSENHTSTFV